MTHRNPQPLDDAALDAIRDDLVPYIDLWLKTEGSYDPGSGIVVWTKRCAALLAEVERLRAENAALRQVAEAADEIATTCRWAEEEPGGVVFHRGLLTRLIEAIWAVEGKTTAALNPEAPDASAALALLEGARWTCEHFQDTHSLMRTGTVRRYSILVEGEFRGNGGTFAAAATDAWLQWRQGADSES